MTEVEDNILARIEAEAVFELALETAMKLPEELRQRYWEVLHFHTATQAKKRGPERPVQSAEQMTEEEARNSERLQMPYGKYGGQSVANVPLDYLSFITGPDTFKEQVRRYLRSDRVQREQG